MFNLKLSQVCRDQLKLLLTDILQLPNQSSEYFQDFRKTKSVTNYKNILEKILKDKPLNLSEKKINEWQNVVFRFV